MVGGLDMRSMATERAKTDEPKSDTDSAKAADSAAPAAREQVQTSRRRERVKRPGRGYEYMDADSERNAGSWAAPVGAAQLGAGILGFAGASAKPASAAGLTTLAGDAFGSCPTMPMLPSSWDSHHDKPDISRTDGPD